MIYPFFGKTEHGVKIRIDVAVEVLFPSTHMQHRAKPNLECSVAKSMPSSDAPHPTNYHAKEENYVTKIQDANDSAVGAEEEMLETVLVFFSYYSLEIS